MSDRGISVLPLFVHTEVEARPRAVPVNFYEPKPYSFKRKDRKLTPEEEAIVRRRVAEAKRRAYARLRERDGR